MPASQTLIREKSFSFYLALLAGILFDFLFYRKPLGVSYPLFVLALLAMFFFIRRQSLRLHAGFAWFLLLATIFLAATFALFSNEVLAVMNFLLVPFMVVAFTVIIAGGNRYEWHDPGFVVDLLEGAFIRTLANIAQPFRIAGEFFKERTGRRADSVTGKIIAGLAVSLPILVVVILLLSSADVVFGHYLAGITTAISEIRLGELIFRIFLILFISAVAFSYISSFSGRQKSFGQKESPPPDDAAGNTREIAIPATNKREKSLPLAVKAWLDPIMAITVLVCVNIVYVLFTVIQISYLFAGAAADLPEGFTYAEYARQGFWELVVVTLINFGMLIVSLVFVKRDRKMLQTIMRMALTLLVAFTLVMLFSAYFRLSLYEQAYGYTRARIFAHSFMAYLFILFLIAVCKIWIYRLPLLKISIIFSIISYVVLNYAGIDCIIARNNIDRYFATGKIDPYYLQTLSDEAVPQLTRLLEGTTAEIAGIVEHNLYLRKERSAREKPWQSFNYTRHKTQQILAAFTLQPADAGYVRE